MEIEGTEPYPGHPRRTRDGLDGTEPYPGQYSRTNNGLIRVYPISGGTEYVWRNQRRGDVQRAEERIARGDLRASREGAINYEQEFTVAELRDILRERGLTVGGRKGELVDRLIEDDELVITVTRRATKHRNPRPRSIFGEPATDQLRSLEIEASRYGAGDYGTKMLKSIFPDLDRVFEYSKSLYTIYDLLEATSSTKPNAKILDFFAGSGTTLHATMLLNQTAEVAGNRQCTLVTNTEMSRAQSKSLWDEGIRPGTEDWNSQANSRVFTFPRCCSVARGENSCGEPLVFAKGHPNGVYLIRNDCRIEDGFPNQGVEFFSLGFVEGSSVRRGDWRWGEDHNLLASIHQVPPDRFRLINTPAQVGELERNIAADDVIEHIFVNSYDQDFYDLASNRFASQGIGVTSLGRYRTHFKTHPIPAHSGGIR